jgi:hypothetical protein
VVFLQQNADVSDSAAQIQQFTLQRSFNQVLQQHAAAVIQCVLAENTVIRDKGFHSSQKPKAYFLSVGPFTIVGGKVVAHSYGLMKEAEALDPASLHQILLLVFYNAACS